MLSTITDSETIRNQRHAGRVTDVGVLGALDALLFDPGRWFALGADNRRVPGVVVPTLDVGLGLLGRGSVATIVGTLLPQVRVVDIDLAGEPGDAAALAVIRWCIQKKFWYLMRPSGGPLGHAHVFIVATSHAPALERFAAELRASMGVGRARIDVRTAVRPLSAPHRSGVVTTPTAPLEATLHTLQQVLSSSNKPTTVSTTSYQASPVMEPARRRNRNDLPPVWQAYLDTGAVPAVTGDDQSRSTIEAVATGFLVRAGHTSHTAWETITAAHPRAFTKARGSRRRWLLWVWNRAVTDDQDFSPAVRVDGQLRLDVDTAEARLIDLAWTFTPKARRTLLRVGHAVLDRALRTGTRRVPVPERDLLLDTGLNDRKVIRTALRTLDGHLGTLHTDTVSTQRKDSTSFEFTLARTRAGGVSQIPPPSFHTPLVLGLWHGLPSTAYQIWRALTRAQEPQPLTKVGVDAQLTDSPDTPLTSAQIRGTRSTLTVLAQVGLAMCTENGLWVATYKPQEAYLARAGAARAAAVAQVTVERDAYRAGVASAWNVQRAAALKANYVREQAWWSGLSSQQRHQRRRRYSATFEGLSVIEQQTWKAEQARRRHRAGVDEVVRHQHWADAQPWDVVVNRSALRAEAFSQLAPPLRQAKAMAWARHRKQFQIPRGTATWQSRIEFAHALPRPDTDRDDALLEMQRSPATNSHSEDCYLELG